MHCRAYLGGEGPWESSRLPCTFTRLGEPQPQESPAIMCWWHSCCLAGVPRAHVWQDKKAWVWDRVGLGEDAPVRAEPDAPGTILSAVACLESEWESL